MYSAKEITSVTSNDGTVYTMEYDKSREQPDLEEKESLEKPE